VVDVRFLPFFQFFLILAPVLFFRFLKGPRLAALFALGAVVAGIFLWTDHHEKFVRSWIKGNYEGFQAAPLRPAYSGVNRYLKGDAASPRAAYEHSMIHHRAGTVRAFESMPYFSGRSTLEGVYIQASLTVPFIFYIQSEISEKPSTPIPDYSYSRFSPGRGAEHLRLFNASFLISAIAITWSSSQRHSRRTSSMTASPSVMEYRSSAPSMGLSSPCTAVTLKLRTPAAAPTLTSPDSSSAAMTSPIRLACM